MPGKTRSVFIVVVFLIFTQSKDVEAGQCCAVTCSGVTVCGCSVISACGSCSAGCSGVPSPENSGGETKILNLEIKIAQETEVQHLQLDLGQQARALVRVGPDTLYRVGLFKRDDGAYVVEIDKEKSILGFKVFGRLGSVTVKAGSPTSLEKIGNGDLAEILIMEE